MKPDKNLVRKPSAPAGGGGKDRKYDKPWLAPEKKPKKEASSFLEHHYPDGVGPDTDLIQMLEREMLDKNPNVSFDDIAGLEETKKLL